MIRVDKIQAGLFGRVGFRQSDITEYAIVSAPNLVATSGLTFQDASEIVSIKNIHDTQENPSTTTNQFNSLLERYQKSAIIEACTKVVTGESDFVNSLNLYPYAKSFKNTITKHGKFVGLKLQPTYYDMAFRITFGELSFDDEDSFNIYVFNSNLSDPIQTKAVTTAAGQSKVISFDLLIANEATYKGGCFFIGYFEDDVTASAYKRDYELSSLSIRTPFITIDPVSIDHDDEVLDITSETFHSDTFGLNFGIELYYDHTDLILNNKTLFDRAIQYQGVIKMLNIIKSSTRSNIQERLTKEITDEANLALYGNSQAKIKGVTQLLDEEIAHVKRTLFPKYRISKGTLWR
jgi:hypothetical protein